MSTTLFQRFAEGQLVLTRCANRAGEGTRLELYAAAGADGRDPVAIQHPAEARQLAAQLDQWAREEREHRNRVR